jgi:RNA polymerase subunit RPABC4/transcription elongation factor Spt4
MLQSFKVCRRCGEEYRPEIERCTDCGGDLVTRFDDGVQKPLAVDDLTPRPQPAQALKGKSPHRESIIYSSRAAADLKPLVERLIDVEIPFRFVCRPGTTPTDPATYGVVVVEDNRAPALRAIAPVLDADPDALAAVESSFDAEGGYHTCPACGQSLDSGAASCPACALALRAEGRACRWCGGLMEPAAEACPHCGRSV